jgi:hypothetical protein
MTPAALSIFDLSIRINHFRYMFMLKHGISVLVYRIFSCLTLEQTGQVLLDELDHSVRSS